MVDLRLMALAIHVVILTLVKVWLIQENGRYCLQWVCSSLGQLDVDFRQMESAACNSRGYFDVG